MKLLAALVTACIGLPMSSCATYNFPVEGTVTDSSTGKPLGGAFVVAQWIRYGSAWPDRRTTCPGLEVVQADANGRYRIPEGKVYLSTEVVRDVFAHFPGYGTDFAADRSDSRLVLKPFVGTEKARIDSYQKFSSLMSCGPADRSLELLAPLYRAIDDELAARGSPKAGDFSKSLARLGRDIEAEKRRLERIEGAPK